MKRLLSFFILIVCTVSISAQKTNVDSLKREALLGNAEAQYTLAYCYYYGDGVNENKTEANRWFGKAFSKYMQLAKQGKADARILHLLGVMYESGQGVKADMEESKKWFKKAFDQRYKLALNGDKNEQFQVGLCYQGGDGVEQNGSEAIKWFLTAAKQGNADAQCELGRCYDRGVGVEEDENQSLYWYYEAAKNGNLKGMYNVGYKMIYVKPEVAISWYEEAAKRGDKNSQSQLWQIYYNGEEVPKNYKESLKWCLKLANEGDYDAIYHLAKCYEEGDGGVDKNDKEAFKWYYKAAKNADPLSWAVVGTTDRQAEAQMKVGTMYLEGKGVQKDRKNAIMWLRKSSDRGNRDAKEILNKLGVRNQ